MAASPTYPGVYIEEIPSGVHAIAGVTTSATAFIGITPVGEANQAVKVSSFAEFERVFGGLSRETELGHAVKQFFLNGGPESWVVRVPDTAAEADWLGAVRALDSVTLLNLLVLPGVTIPSIVLGAVEYCETRRAFLILDSPVEAKTPDQIQQVVQSGALTRSANAAVYYPWIKVANASGENVSRLSAPSGTIAGVYSRSDSARGVWKAPAGVEAELNGVQGLEHSLKDSENGMLDSLGINCLRRFLGNPPVVWGARTLAGADALGSEWKYVPVRRLALYLEESISQGIQWAVFEPNDERLWAQLRLNIGAFMQGLFRQGALQGQTPKDGYFVKCDAETTTQNDINLGIVNIVVGFAPVKPAEFVILKIQQNAGQVAP